MSRNQINDFQSANNISKVSDRILAAVADKEGKSPLEFDCLLSEAIDPDALNNLFLDRTQQGSVAFSYMGYRVTVSARGHVDVTDEND